MHIVSFPSNERGHVQFDWLDTYHSFSFGSYHDPKKVHYGALRVLNDDKIGKYARNFVRNDWRDNSGQKFVAKNANLC